MIDGTLSIATVPLHDGGRIGICRMPGLFGALDADIAAIVAWNPTIVVSVVEQSELDEFNGGRLGEKLAAAPIAWVHLPIRDHNTPEGCSRDAWPKLDARLHRVLDDGGAVLLHCQGGRGRSGMIALRILVERGEEVGAALTRLRSARPEAVETDAQLAWASSRPDESADGL